MSIKSPVVLPSIRTLPLPDEAKELFSWAVTLLKSRLAEFEPVGAWLDMYYSEQVIYKRWLPAKKKSWDDEQHQLSVAPTTGEWNCSAGGPKLGWTCQEARTFKALLAQHRKASKHPGYRRALAQRRSRLNDLKNERRNWRPSRQDRLRLATEEIIEAEYPDVPAEHLEHSCKIVAISALLAWPEPLPTLGELGAWEWESQFADDAKPESELERILAVDLKALDGPHQYHPTIIHARNVGRCETIFHRCPGKDRSLERESLMDDWLKLLTVAVDELETHAEPEQPSRDFPDLGREDDLNHPMNRLGGIDNYCNNLRDSAGANGYAGEAKKLCKAIENEGRSYQWSQNASSHMDLHLFHIKQRQFCEDMCEWHFKRLCELAEAIRLTMPDVLRKW